MHISPGIEGVLNVSSWKKIISSELVFIFHLHLLKVFHFLLNEYYMTHCEINQIRDPGDHEWMGTRFGIYRVDEIILDKKIYRFFKSCCIDNPVTWHMFATKDAFLNCIMSSFKIMLVFNRLID